MSRTALVVDDSRATRTLLRRLLQGCDFTTTHEAGNGQEALERLDDVGAVDLILVDWNMPVMDGLECIKAIRARPAHERAIVMMVTSESEPAHIARALMAGADEYAIKPLTSDALLEKLELVGLGAGT